MAKTSTAVKQRYLDKTYDRVSVRLPKDLVQAFKEACTARGISQAQVVRSAIEDFLDESEKKQG